MHVGIIEKTTGEEHLILLSSSAKKFPEYLETQQEKDYVEKSFADDKNKQLILNQYRRFLYLVRTDSDKPGHDRLQAVRKLGHRICRSVNQNKIESVVVQDLDRDADVTMAFIEGLLLSNYQFLKYLKKKDEKKNTLDSVNLVNGSIELNKLENLHHLVHAVYHTRDLVNEPLSYLTASRLSKEIHKLADESGFTLEVFDKKKIESLKMGGLLAVNKGSIDPPTFNILTWKPDNAKNKKPVILVGKGVVYDTGGLSLKPTHDSMDYMKCDMAGAAAVAGTFYAIAKANLPVYVIGLIPATDNRPDGNAYVPGDVITMFDGTTVEVLNTDAEGRLILADALSFARKYDPELVVEFSTLTGSSHYAIGHYGMVGMGTANKEITDKIKESGSRVYERIAEFPFWEEYDELLKSQVADLKNIGGRIGGSITAGKFLAHFTDYPFYHLDIAGPAFIKKRDAYLTTGGTGYGVRMMFDFLSRYA